MKRLILWMALLLPFFANAQVNGTIQKTASSGTIRGSFGSLGLDTIPRVTGVFVNGYILKYNAATNKWYASPDPTLVGLQDSLTKKANRTFDNVASGAIANVKLANSTISGVALGTNLNTLALGYGLTGTSYNGSSAVTTRVDTTQIQTVANFFPKGDTRYAKIGYIPTLGTSPISLGGTANGLSYSGGNYRLHKVTATTGGVLTTGTDTIAGNKLFTGNIYLPASTSSNGVIYQNGTRLIHTYEGTGAQGRSFYAGRGAGNFTGNNYASTGVGDSVLARNTTGVSLTGVGTSVLSKNTTGYGNTSVGTVSMGENTTGFANSNLGWHGLLTNTTGSYNAGIGAEGMRSNTTGSHNSWVGFSAGYNTNYSYGVYIGNEAGYNAGKDSTLWIDVSSTSNPLIYGDFNRRTVKFNNSGGFESTGNITAPAFIGALTGTLTNSRTIFGQSFNGSSNVSGNISDILTLTAQSGGLNGAYRFGGDINSTGLTNNTRKYASFGVPHYANASAPMAMIIGDVASTTNNIYIGGGQASLNAATNIEFYAAASTTTATGTKQLGITSSGINIPSAAGTGTRMVVANNLGDISTQAIPGGGGGSVTGVAVASANGLSGTSDGNSVVPTLTLSTTVNAPLLAGNGTAISAATTTGSGSTAVLATSPTLVTPTLGVASATALTVTGTATAAQGMMRKDASQGLQILGIAGSTSDVSLYSSTLTAPFLSNPTGTLNTIFGGSISATNLSGTNTGDQTTITGNAGTATALQTARNIQGVSFNGTADINPINGTGFVKASGTTLSYDNTTYAPLNSPAFTGTPTAPTQTQGDNSTKIATTAYVDALGGTILGAQKQIATTYTNISTSGTSEQSLFNHNIAQSNLSSDGDRIDFNFVGSFGLNANDKYVRISVGGNLIPISGNASNKSVWEFEGYLMRTSSTTFRIFIKSGVDYVYTSTVLDRTVTDFNPLNFQILGQTNNSSFPVTVQMGYLQARKAP